MSFDPSCLLARSTWLEAPVGHQAGAFFADRDYFAEPPNQERRFAVRALSPHELPGDPSVFSRPTTYVCVCRLSPALHLLFAVWAGREFFRVVQHDNKEWYLDASSDEEVAAVIAACSEHGARE